MPQAADLSILDGLATPVARTFVLRTPCAGDNSPALWTYNLGAHMETFPKFTLSSRKGNGAKPSRKCFVKFQMPFSLVDPSTGETRVVSEASFSAEVTVPTNFPESSKNDFIAFATNGVNNAIIKACLRDGMPAT